MILSAIEVRYMSDNYYVNKLNYIMNCIKDSSYGGNYSVIITEQIDDDTIKKLQFLGYTVEEDSWKIEYEISW